MLEELADLGEFELNPFILFPEAEEFRFVGVRVRLAEAGGKAGVAPEPSAMEVILLRSDRVQDARSSKPRSHNPSAHWLHWLRVGPASTECPQLADPLKVTPS